MGNVPGIKYVVTVPVGVIFDTDELFKFDVHILTPSKAIHSGCTDVGYVTEVQSGSIFVTPHVSETTHVLTPSYAKSQKGSTTAISVYGVTKSVSNASHAHNSIPDSELVVDAVFAQIVLAGSRTGADDRVFHPNLPLSTNRT